jgi:type IV pilus assembly protein PilB
VRRTAEDGLPEKNKLGEILVGAGLIDEFQLIEALGEQARFGDRLGETLVQLGFVSEAELVRTLSRHYGVPSVRLEGKRIEPEVLALLTAEVAEEYRCIPLFRKRIGGGEALYLGMAHPEDLRIVDDVSFRVGLPIRPVVVGPVQLGAAIAAFYRGEGPRLLRAEETASVLAEMPVPDGDTAPLFNDLRPVVPAPSEEIASEPQSASGDAESPVAQEEAAPLPTKFEKPREVPTRDILHALTQLLIENGVISREELLERIATNKERSAS